MKKARLGIRRVAAYFSAVYLALFLLFYLPNYAFSANIVWLEYVRHFITELSSYTLPVIGASAVFNFCARFSKKSVLYSLILALTHAVYLLPYYYLYMLAYGFDSIEAVGLSFIINLMSVAVNTAHVALFALVIELTVRHRLTVDLRSTLPPLKRDDRLTSAQLEEIRSAITLERTGKNPFSTSSPLNQGILTVTLLQFALTVILELYDTVSYLIEYSGSYRIGEIIFITASYFFIILLLPLTQFIAVKLSPLTEDNEENFPE